MPDRLPPEGVNGARKRVLKTAQCADLVGVSTRTLLSYVKLGLPCHPLSVHELRFFEDEVLTWINDLKSKHVLSVAEAAVVLGVKTSTVYRYERLGKIPAHLSPKSKRMRFYRSDVLAFKERQRDKPIVCEAADGQDVVYFLAASGTGLVKVGHTNRFALRMRALQTVIPVRLRLIKVVAGGEKLEASLHQKWATHRQHGEWFRFEPIRKDIAKLKGARRV